MIRSILLAAVLAVICDVPSTHAQGTAKEIADIKAVLDKQAVDWNHGDLDAYYTGYKNSPDILFIGSTTQRGYQGMIEGYRQAFPNHDAMGVLTFSNEEVHPIDANVASVIGNFHLERTAAGGGNADGYYSLVMEKTPAGWKIILDHTTSTPQKPVILTGPTCGPEARQFDFWLGEWSVTGPKGKHVGDSSIQKILGGCVILENWSAGANGAGKSFNTYDTATKTWRQSWVDAQGNHADFDKGVWTEPSLVFEGHNPSPKNEPAIQRFTFTRLDANNVRQMQEESIDGGKTWYVSYDFHYTRKPA